MSRRISKITEHSRLRHQPTARNCLDRRSSGQPTKKEITLTLMMPCRVIQQPGMPQLENRVRVANHPALSVSVEEIKLNDLHLSGVGGERICRILPRAANPARQGKWSLRIDQV